PVRDAGRDQHLPRAQRSYVEGVAFAEGRGVRAQVREGELKEAVDGGPTVRLMQGIVKRFEGAGVIERCRELSGFGRKMRSESVPDAPDREEKAAVVGPDRIGLPAASADQL